MEGGGDVNSKGKVSICITYINKQIIIETSASTSSHTTAKELAMVILLSLAFMSAPASTSSLTTAIELVLEEGGVGVNSKDKVSICITCI